MTIHKNYSKDATRPGFTVNRSTRFIDVVDKHTYKLQSVNDDYKDFVVENIGEKFVFEFIKKDYDVRVKTFDDSLFNRLVNRCPGFMYDDEKYADSYIQSVYNKLFSNNQFVKPRGYISKDTVIILGFAPGVSINSFGEPCWLFGPSSAILHDMLSFDYRFYFTNVSKIPLLNNNPSDSNLDSFLTSLFEELEFFKDQKIVILGQYKIYDVIMQQLPNREFIVLKHPSYFTYNGGKGFAEEKQKLQHFLKPR